MATKCPRCGFNVTALYQCDECGHKRCDGGATTGGKGACGSTKSPTGKPAPARKKGFCHECGKGKYHKI